ncbi:MAG TPA: sigma 54-interacting transcriptional regulator [Planctomycetota bacterium]|nr:sigma 54-interacting transcriptional regulator [Planctomycetota bacterium]
MGTGRTERIRFAQIGRVLAANDTSPSAFARFADLALEATRARRAFVIEVGTAGSLTVLAARDRQRRDVPPPERQVSDALVRRVLEEGVTLFTSPPFESLHGLGKDVAVDASTLGLDETRVRSILVAPILTDSGEPLGAIVVDDDDPTRSFSLMDRVHIEPFTGAAVCQLERLRETRAAAAPKGRRSRELAGSSPAFLAALARADRVAPFDESVLLVGESGTGKEPFARRIHARSPRAKGSFIAVNVAALPEKLVESELFGHIKGAFTGADCTKPGLFEMAREGTIFLDEIGELALPLQAKLLRVLQEGAIRPVGAMKEVPCDFRVIAATNRDLRAMVAKDLFRLDLYQRLRVVKIEVPPLRCRREDIPDLVDAFVDRYGAKFLGRDWRLGEGTLDKLVAYPWPGNVRELENAVRGALIECPDGLLLPEHFVLDEALVAPGPNDLVEVKRQHALDALARTGGDKAAAAAILGCSVSSLKNWLRGRTTRKPRLLPKSLREPA